VQLATGLHVVRANIRMSGAIPPLPQNVFMMWYLIKNRAMAWYLVKNRDIAWYLVKNRDNFTFTFFTSN
jgi:hypothetical protein